MSPKNKKIQSKQKKKNISLPFAHVYVKTSSNNTIITITDTKGNKIIGGGTGLYNFKGSKQSTPFASELTSKNLLLYAKENFNLSEIGIICSGVGLGRDGLFKAINEIGGIDILFIKERTPIQTGGCKGVRYKRN